MSGLSGAVRWVAAIAALGINVALAGGLASLASHYGEQAAKGLDLAAQARPAGSAHASAQRCVPEPARAG